MFKPKTAAELNELLAAYGEEMSLKKLRAQRLKHKVALVITQEPARAEWRK